MLSEHKMALLIMDYAKALFDIAMIIAVQALMLAQVSLGYYRLKGEVPDGVTVRETLPKDAAITSLFNPIAAQSPP